MASSTSTSWLGFPVMDVFNIMYLGVDEIVPEKQLGTIKLHSSGGVQYLYKVEDVDVHRPSIKYGDSIPVTIKGPSIPFFDYVLIEFDLFCGAYKGKKRLQWDPLPHEVSVKSVFFTANDGTGQILVYIGGYANATVASLEIKLLDNSADKNVCGVVFASNSELELGHCANVLFREKSENGFIVAQDGLIPLSRSFVGVPLHSELYVEVSLSVNGHPVTGFVRFDPVKDGVCENFLINDKEEKIFIKVTWIDIAEFGNREGLIQRVYDRDSVTQRNVTWLRKQNESLFGMARELALAREVALEIESLHENQSGETMAEIYASCCPGIITEISFHVKDPGSRNRTTGLLARQVFRKVEQSDTVQLFNLIQAANHFQIKSLMKFTCRHFVYRVMQKRSYFEEDIPHSKDDILLIDSILRQREKETFINKPLLVDVPISPLATERPRLYEQFQNLYFGRCFSIFMESDDSQHIEPVKFREATEWLNDLANGDAGLAVCLSSEAVECLLGILAEIDNSKDRKDLVTIQSLAVRILSRALSHNMFHKYSRDAVPALVKLMSNPITDLSIAGVMALTRLAYVCPRCMQVILKNGALEQAQEVANKIRNLPLAELRQWVAKFLAVVCYRDLPEHKVKVALMISEVLLTKDSVSHRHIVSTCYALQYLTYKRTVAIQGEAWDKLMRKLIGLIINCFRIDCTVIACSPPVLFGSTVIASSALGVVGNIARWGHSDQIQTLANDSRLLQCLAMMLRFEFKKFTKEACQIISNIAARRQLCIQNMHKANLLKPLYHLLTEDIYESDVKMEAAWAIYNGVYGDEYRQIDQYSRDDDLIDSELQLYCPEIKIC